MDDICKKQEDNISDSMTSMGIESTPISGQETIDSVSEDISISDLTISDFAILGRESTLQYPGIATGKYLERYISRIEGHTNVNQKCRGKDNRNVKGGTAENPSRLHLSNQAKNKSKPETQNPRHVTFANDRKYGCGETNPTEGKETNASQCCLTFDELPQSSFNSSLGLIDFYQQDTTTSELQHEIVELKQKNMEHVEEILSMKALVSLLHERSSKFEAEAQELKRELETKDIRLAVYEKFETTIDSAILVRGRSSGSSQELLDHPTNPERRIEYSIKLAERLVELETELISKQEEILKLYDERENLRLENNIFKSNLTKPAESLFHTIKEQTGIIASLNAKLALLQANECNTPKESGSLKETTEVQNDKDVVEITQAKPVPLKFSKISNKDLKAIKF